MRRTREQGDALVIFGVTGDLAFKHIIPALQRMIQRASWRCRSWALPAAHERLRALVGHVWGTYDDPQTYVALRDALGAAKRPVHYLAIPPELFPTVIGQLGGVGLGESARVVVEKPFGRDLESSRTLNQALHRVSREDRCSRIDHHLGKSPVEDIELTAMRLAAHNIPPDQRLLSAAPRGEHDLFASQETIEEAWRIVDPILGEATPVHQYERGSWGPVEADRLAPAHGWYAARVSGQVVAHPFNRAVASTGPHAHLVPAKKESL